MKNIETVNSIELNNVTGGCAQCGNPAHTSTLTNGPQQLGQQAGQAAAQWGAKLGGRLGNLFRR
jgi:hypothetical protein